MNELVGFINFFLGVHVAREVMANEKIISPAIAGVSLKRIEEWIVVVASKYSAPDKLLRLLKPRVWLELMRGEKWLPVRRKIGNTF